MPVKRKQRRSRSRSKPKARKSRSVRARRVIGFGFKRAASSRRRRVASSRRKRRSSNMGCGMDPTFSFKGRPKSYTNKRKSRRNTSVGIRRRVRKNN